MFVECIFFITVNALGEPQREQKLIKRCAGQVRLRLMWTLTFRRLGDYQANNCCSSYFIYNYQTARTQLIMEINLYTLPAWQVHASRKVQFWRRQHVFYKNIQMWTTRAKWDIVRSESARTIILELLNRNMKYSNEVVNIYKCFGM